MPTNFNINPYIQPYVGGVQKETRELIGQRVADYDLSAEGYDILGYQTDTLKQNVAPFEADKLYAQELMGKYRGEVDKAAEKGDYEFMLRDVKKSAREFAAETSPLLARRKAFDDYRKTTQDQYQKGDIDLEMYNAALAKTTHDNSNVDKEAVKSGSFSGFVPTKKVDISKMLDDAIKGMESNGTLGKIQTNADGTYTIVGGEYRTPQDILKAANSYLQGSSDYRNYASTLVTLGLQNKLANETVYAEDFVQNKYKFYKDKSTQGFIPEYIAKGQANLEAAKRAHSVQDVATSNPQSKNPYSDLRFVDGRLIFGDYIEKINNGSEWAYYQNKVTGEKISPTNYAQKQGQGLISQAFSGDDIITNYQIVRVANNKDLEKVQGEQQLQLEDDSRNRFLIESAQKFDDVKQWLNDPIAYKDQIEKFVNERKDQWGSMSYKQQTATLYGEAADNNKNIMWNRRWEIPKQTIYSPFGGEGSKLDKNEIVANLSGQDLHVLSADKELQGYRKGSNKDINSLLEEISKIGEIQDVSQTGVAQYNPYDTRPAMRYDFVVKDSNDKLRTISVGASVDDRRLQVVQDVMMLAATGRSGQVNLEDIQSVNGYLNGKLNILVTPNSDPNSKKQVPFIGTVQIFDDKGKLHDNVPINQFPDYYKNVLVPDLLVPYVK